VVCTPVAKRLWEGSGGGLGGGGSRKAARYSSSSSSSSVALTLGAGNGVNGNHNHHNHHNHNNNNSNNNNNSSNNISGLTPDGTSPGALSMYTSDSPVSYHDDEEEDDMADESAEEQYRQICNMYTMYSMLNVGAAGQSLGLGIVLIFPTPVPKRYF